jgi:hypothetical protein
MYKNHTLKTLLKSQSDGAQVLGNKGFEYLPHHQIQVEVSAQPSVGVLAVEYKTPGATEYVAASGSPIDLTVLNKAAAFRLDNLFIEAIKFTPTGLDAEKTYSVIVTSNE